MAISQADRKLISSRAGSRFGGYLRQVDEPGSVAHVEAQARSFRIGGEPIVLAAPGTDLGKVGILDLGGQWMNESMLSTTLTLNENPRVAESVATVTGWPVTDQNSFGLFLMHRYVDADRTLDRDAPIVGLTDAVYVVADPHGAQNPPGPFVVRVDRTGVRRLEVDVPAIPLKADLTKSLIPRTRRFGVDLDGVLGFDPDGVLVRGRIAERVPVPVPKESRSRFEQVTLVDPVPVASPPAWMTAARALHECSPGSCVPQTGGLAAMTVSGINGIPEIERTVPPGTAPAGAVWGSQECASHSWDSCRICCFTISGTVSGVGIGIGMGMCTAAGWAWGAGCIVGGVVGLGATVIGSIILSGCQSNCNRLYEDPALGAGRSGSALTITAVKRDGSGGISEMAFDQVNGERTWMGVDFVREALGRGTVFMVGHEDPSHLRLVRRSDQYGGPYLRTAGDKRKINNLDSLPVDP